MAMRADPARVRAAVAAVPDPEIGKPLGELGMIGEISVGRGGQVRLQLRLTTASCPQADELRHTVDAAVRSVDGVRTLHIEVVTMTARERAELAERLNRDATPLDFFTGRLASPHFIQFGQDYAGARDEYIYASFPAGDDGGSAQVVQPPSMTWIWPVV